MFYYLDGTVAEILPGLAVIDCGGVGYACMTTNNTLSQLKKGEKKKQKEKKLCRKRYSRLWTIYRQKRKHRKILLLHFFLNSKVLLQLKCRNIFIQ